MSIAAVPKPVESRAEMPNCPATLDLPNPTSYEAASLRDVETLFVNQLPIGCHSVDALGTLTQINNTELAWFGYRADEILGKLRVPDLMTPESQRKFAVNFPRLIDQGFIRDAEYDFVRKDGSTFTVLANVVADRDTHGNFIGARAFLIDITERKRAEQKLQRSEADLRHAQSVADFGSYEIGTDAHAAALGYSQQVFMILGLDPATTQPLSTAQFLTHFVHPEDRERVTALSADALANGTPVDCEYRIVRNDGAVRYLRDVALPLFDAEGRLERYFGVIQDITKTKLAQLRILENKRRFRRLVEHSHDGIAILSTTGEVKYASPSTIRLLGYEPNELLGRQSLDFYLPEERSAAIRAMQAVLQEPSKPVTHRFRIVRRDGAVRWLEAHRSNHCDDPAIDGIVCNFRDVTDSIAAQEAIEASNAKLHKLAQHLQRMREQERANLARELHDELGATLGAIKMYLVDPADAKADWRRGEAVKRVRTLVDNAMAATRRITTNLRPSILDHRGLPAALEWLALELSESTDLRCRVSLESGAMSTLDDNARSAVFRIVQEALRNISQHAQASNVYLLAKRTDGDLIVEVHDDGRGIDSAELGKPTSWGITGMQERAHALGGKLCVQRRPKQGTVVKVRVPLET